MKLNYNFLMIFVFQEKNYIKKQLLNVINYQKKENNKLNNNMLK